MAGGAAAGEEIEHDVAGTGGLLQQVLDQRQRLGVVEGAVAENFGDDAGAFLIGRRREAAFGFVVQQALVGFDLALDALGLIDHVVELGLLFLRPGSGAFVFNQVTGFLFQSAQALPQILNGHGLPFE